MKSEDASAPPCRNVESVAENGGASRPAAETSPYTIYSKNEKAVIIITVSMAAAFSGFASNIYFPALPTIASDLGTTVELVNLTVTSYMILQGLAPSIWGALADVKGRRITYIYTFLIFFAACVGLANSRNLATLIAVRCVQSAGSAATIAIGSGVIGDLTTRADRGGYMGIYTAGLLVPLVAGPILGGGLANSLGWRSIFWFLAIYSGVFLIFLILVLPETLRALVGNGSVPGRGIAKFPLSVFQRRAVKRSPHLEQQTLADLPPPRSVNILGSFKILVDRRVVLMISFLAVYYTMWQMSVTVMSTLFEATYGLNETQIGLTFIANGFGSMLGTVSTGKILDADYKKIRARCEAAGREIPLDRARLRTVWVWSAMQMSSLLVFGWTLNQRVHIAAPIIATFFTGWGAMSVQSMVSTYLVDVFPDRSASAAAALNLARCLLGAAGTAAAAPILSALGVGWGFTVLVAIMLAALGLVGLQVAFGKKWREREEARETLEKQPQV